MRNENNIEIFNFNDSMVRTLVLNDEVYFVAKDICNVLDIQNSREATKKLDEDELVSEKMTSGGQTREMTLINESGMYKLIFRSNKPEAKKFTKWITSEVLPSIRKTGSYSTSKNSNVNYTSDKNQYIDSTFIKSIKDLYGAKIAREYFAPILNIKYNEDETITREQPLDKQIENFIDKYVAISDDEFTSTKVLYNKYKQWATLENIDILIQTQFVRKFNTALKTSSYQQRVNGDRIQGYRLGLKD